MYVPAVVTGPVRRPEEESKAPGGKLPSCTAYDVTLDADSCTESGPFLATSDNVAAVCQTGVVATCRVNSRSTYTPSSVLVARTVNTDVPSDVGVPVIAPLMGANSRPAGKAPSTTANLVALVASSCRLASSLFSSFANAPAGVFHVMAGATFSEKT